MRRMARPARARHLAVAAGPAEVGEPGTSAVASLGRRVFQSLSKVSLRTFSVGAFFGAVVGAAATDLSSFAAESRATMLDLHKAYTKVATHSSHVHFFRLKYGRPPNSLAEVDVDMAVHTYKEHMIGRRVDASGTGIILRTWRAVLDKSGLARSSEESDEQFQLIRQHSLRVNQARITGKMFYKRLLAAHDHNLLDRACVKFYRHHARKFRQLVEPFDCLGDQTDSLRHQEFWDELARFADDPSLPRRIVLGRWCKNVESTIIDYLRSVAGAVLVLATTAARHVVMFDDCERLSFPS